jgi:hypothetical protein
MENRMDTMLATNADAQLILKLYELRTEVGMRKARKWVTEQFWPQTAQDALRVLCAFGTDENAYLRQVLSYWEMAAAFVLHGALDADLFLACNGENLFILAKLHPFLKEIREESPFFLIRTEELTMKFPTARRRLEAMIKREEARRAQKSSQTATG